MYVPIISEMVDIVQRAKRSREIVSELREFEEKWRAGDKSIMTQRNNGTHIEQKDSGNLLTGTAGLSLGDVRHGYVCKIGTMNGDGRTVDIAITEDQWEQLILTLKNDIQNEMYIRT